MENLIGQTFNFLTVVDGPIRKNKKIFWVCKCECGNSITARADQLKSGRTKSCGCYRTKIFVENNKKRNTLDLTNQRFGKLIALEIIPEERSFDGRRLWKCQCDCGNICIVDTHSLQQHKKTSCGCLKSRGEEKIQQLLEENNIIFENQKIFETCRFPDTQRVARFDFWVNNQYIIEYDGEQHFFYKDSPYTWNTKENFMKTKEHDNFKTQWCLDNNIPLIRISYLQLDNLTISDLLL